MEDSIRLG
jgi:translocation protein SEC62